MMPKNEYERFVKLAFCRADLLLELNESHEIVFAAGASKVLVGRAPEELPGTPFSSLIDKSDRTMASQILAAAGEHGRIDDSVLRLNGPAARALKAAVAGYRAADFNSHFFLAVKAERDVASFLPEASESAERVESDEMLEEQPFSRLAAERVKTFQNAGGRAQITLLKMDNLSGLLKKIGASKKKELLSTIGGILKSDALGGDTASKMDDQNFSFVHSEDIIVEDVNDRIEAAARQADPEGPEVKGHFTTLDADGAGLSDKQVAKAVIHTMKTFCDKGSVGTKHKLSQIVSTMMADTVQTVAVIRGIAKETNLKGVFMPICDLRRGKVQHFEMLTRFHEPKHRGTPFHLISLAEDVEIVHELDAAICRWAIKKLREFEKKNPIPPVAVNLSGQSLVNPRFVEELHKLLKMTGIGGDRIMFEVTESARIANLELVNAHIQSFREKGFKFALDDFGAGSASFDYLNMLDADYVKFDGPVVRRACATRKGSEMLNTLAKMCANLQVKTVAEMVENKKMANQVYYCGIDYGQGWHFGKPTENPYEFADQFAAWEITK